MSLRKPSADSAASPPVEYLVDLVRERGLDPSPDNPNYRTNGPNTASLSQKAVRIKHPDSARTIPDLAFEPDILDRFRADIRTAGVAGEETLASVVYLAVTSRLLPWGKPTERPVSVTTKGTSSTGKSYASRSTLRFFPASAYIDLGSMSRRYLFYTDESFAHRFIYVPEWASIKDDEELVALLRVLVSEGRIVHGTVDIDRSARVITKEGPTGLLMTTTVAETDAELETRCLSILTDDSGEQTRRAFLAMAALEDDLPTVDYESWHELQEWLADQDRCVHVPFVTVLAQSMPTTAVRLRRDFGALVSLVRSHALLHQVHRDVDDRDRVVATIEGDYAPVRELVGDLIAEGVEATVTRAMRETVQAVEELTAQRDYVPPRPVIDKLEVGKSAGYDRITRALRTGYIVNGATKEERGMKLAVGSPLPGAENFLPKPEELVRVMSGVAPGRANHLVMRDSGVLSGSPGSPAGGRVQTHLVDVDGRCKRHHDTPAPWCVECRETAA